MICIENFSIRSRFERASERRFRLSHDHVVNGARPRIWSSLHEAETIPAPTVFVRAFTSRLS